MVEAKVGVDGGVASILFGQDEEKGYCCHLTSKFNNLKSFLIQSNYQLIECNTPFISLERKSYGSTLVRNCEEVNWLFQEVREVMCQKR